MEPYYQDDLCTIYHGDSIKIVSQLPKVDLIVTDPPYGIDYQSNRAKPTGNIKDKIENDTLSAYLDLLNFITDMFDFIMTDNSEAYMFCGGGGELPVMAHAWLAIEEAKRAKVKNVLVWDKLYFGMGWDWRFQYENIFQLQVGEGLSNKMSSNRSNVLRCKKVVPQAGDHPTPKPIALIEQILKPKPSKLILDPFMGSGTTLVAAKNLHRKAIGIELEEKYCEMAAKRLSQGTLDLGV